MNTRINPESRIGKKENDWTILDIKRANRKFQYLVRCKCGFERYVLYGNLKKMKCCESCLFEEKASEYVGKTFGKLTVLGIGIYKGRRALHVKCQCKNEYFKQIYELKNAQGCCRCRKGLYPGLVIDDLTLLEYLGNRKYKIKCICGNIFEAIPRKYRGILSTCGCKRRDKFLNDAKKKVGSSYKFLTISKLLGNLEGQYIFEMKCKCGNKILRQNGKEFKSDSCGCLVKKNNPKGEKRTQSKLKNHEVIAMRELYDSGEYSIESLSEMYNLNESYVTRIIRRWIWKSI